mgnify:CR=1 FL=1
MHRKNFATVNHKACNRKGTSIEQEIDKLNKTNFKLEKIIYRQPSNVVIYYMGSRLLKLNWIISVA